MTERRYTIRELQKELELFGIRGQGTWLAQRIGRYQKEKLLSETSAATGKGGRLGKNYSLETLRRLVYIIGRRKNEPRVSDEALRNAIAAGDHGNILRTSASPGGLYFFLSCSAGHSEIMRMVRDSPMVVGTYHVCGDQPWFLVARVSDPKQIHDLSLERNSINQVLQTTHSDDTFVFPHRESTPGAWHTFIQVEGYSSATLPHAQAALDHANFPVRFQPFIEWTWAWSQRDGDLVPLRAHAVFGTCSMVLEVRCRTGQSLFAFIRGCADVGIATSAKCVLVTWKHDGQWQEYAHANMQRLEALESPAREAFDYAFQVALHNHGDKLTWARPAQVDFYSQLVKRVAKRDYPDKIRDVLGEINEWTPCDDNASKSSFMTNVARILLSVAPAGWVRVFFCVKARLGRLAELETELTAFLGVERTYCALKLLRCTGRYDFIVPIDCANDHQAVSDIGREWEAYNDLIDGEVHHVVVRRAFEVGDLANSPFTGSLSDLTISLIRHFTERNRSLSTFANDLQALIQFVADPAAEPTNPWLYRLYHAYAKDLETSTGSDETLPRRVAAALRSQLPRWPGRSDGEVVADVFGTLGLRPHVELGQDSHHALVRLSLRNRNKLGQLMLQLMDEIKGNRLAVEVYQFVRNPLEVVAFIRHRDFVELEVFLKEKREQYCRRTSFGVIFGQCYYDGAAQADSLPATVPLKNRLLRRARQA